MTKLEASGFNSAGMWFWRTWIAILSNQVKKGRRLNLIKLNSGKENTQSKRLVVVGGVETGTMRMFLVAVQDRTAETLMAEVKA
jgi:hypothetical protein